MARSLWKRRSWLRRFSRQPRIGTREFAPLEHGLYPESCFREKLVQERRRAERSNKPLIVMVLEAEQIGDPDGSGEITDSLGEGVNACVRGTDICGLLKAGGPIGVILTEVEPEKVDAAKRIIAKKTRERLAEVLTAETVSRIAISFRIYPETGGSGSFDMTFYPELAPSTPRKIGEEVLKRSLDLVGSIAGLILFSPFFAALPVLIKLTSKGPVFFRQDRVGRNGRKFKFIKFRSMYLDNDDVIHREYVKQLIKGKITEQGAPNGVYKIQGDPRVTPVGRFIRKYSLDELPQFINVLKGDMSLVGPRPPICYEVEHYSGWQRNRLVGKRPGITGLWQVTGRSSTTFDDMVRLDLRYLNRWTIALDLKILLRTPGAVIKCKGAY
ncbi:MAG: glycosyl transferase [Geobacteraceae bacterium GWC2_58_44]|nr:MAG: glycosyl transferase [Geobacteraceae bacterium GWC2_58_44]HBG07407.1 glycosyl transferase [Geobacter sp.]